MARGRVHRVTYRSLHDASRTSRRSVH
jgi:hypothetical protein